MQGDDDFLKSIREARRARSKQSDEREIREFRFGNREPPHFLIALYFSAILLCVLIILVTGVSLLDRGEKSFSLRSSRPAPIIQLGVSAPPINYYEMNYHNYTITEWPKGVIQDCIKVEKVDGIIFK